MTRTEIRTRTLVLALVGFAGFMSLANRAEAQNYPRLTARHSGSGSYENRGSNEKWDLTDARVVLDDQGRALIDLSGRQTSLSLRGRITKFNGREHVDIVLDTFDGVPTNAKGWIALDRRGGFERIEFDGQTPVRLGVSFYSKGPNLEPPPPPARPEPPTQSPDAGNLTEEYGVNRRGGDYRHFDAPGLRDCQDACRNESRCRAYSYNLNRRVCYLKSEVPATNSDREVTSGVKKGWSGGGSGGGGGNHDDNGYNGGRGRLTEDRGLDRRGGDYSDFRARNLDDCQDACRRDNRCRAYSFNTVDGSCYLKDRVNSEERNRDMVTGVKQ